jgi:hypothetical protein
MRAINDLTGRRFGSLVVLGPTEKYAKSGDRLWRLRCDCGQERIVKTSHLTQQVRPTHACASCGEKAHTKHGMSRHPAYWVWCSMRARCRLPTSQVWHNYGGRGITVCDRWLESFENFWEDMGPTYRPGLTIERVDNMKGYSPENCIWATPKVQSRNQRRNRTITTPWGKMTLSEASERGGISISTLRSRLARTSDLYSIFSLPNRATRLSMRFTMTY